MLFSTITFVGLFLPLLCAVYLLSKSKYHNVILLIASLIFYAWGEPKYLIVMLLSILVNYFGAIAVYKCQGVWKKFSLIFTIALNLGFLVYFKYINFIIDNVNTVFHGHIDFIKVALPLGISFYTFQALSYVVDVYRGECKVQKNVYKLALFICLFPQLIAGPILKYHDVAAQFENREISFAKVDAGVKRFIVGLAKKTLLANTMGLVADKVFAQAPDAISPLVAWVGAITYSFQLFFDFSGYSDMAIGLGLILGFKFMENFNYPYISKSITEFWRRWHISLSTWFREYVYIPLGGNRHGKIKQLRNLGVVFLLTGVWHGASWNFIIWGLWHGFFIVLEKITGLSNDMDNKLVNFLRRVYCILIFVIGWVIFRAENIDYACKYIRNMFGCINIHDVKYQLTYYGNWYELLILFACVICAVPIFVRMNEWLLYDGTFKKIFANTLVNVWLIVLFILSVASIAASTYNPFIYFRF